MKISLNENEEIVKPKTDKKIKVKKETGEKDGE